MRLDISIFTEGDNDIGGIGVAKGGFSSGVERVLCMHEAMGSIPIISRQLLCRFSFHPLLKSDALGQMKRRS